MHFSQLHTLHISVKFNSTFTSTSLELKKVDTFLNVFHYFGFFFTDIEKGNPLIYFFINSAIYFFHSGSTQLVLETEPGPGALDTKQVKAKMINNNAHNRTTSTSNTHPIYTMQVLVMLSSLDIVAAKKIYSNAMVMFMQSIHHIG